MGKAAEKYEYDVCLSFAGEQRRYVDAVAEGLRGRSIKVFYDAYERSTLWGKDLYEHLDYIYQHAAQYCVVFASVDYARKLWTRHERRSAQARAFRENKEYILPARFDDTEIPGVPSTIGYIDLRATSPAELVDHIVQKLRTRYPSPKRAILTPRPEAKRIFKPWKFRTDAKIWTSPVVAGGVVYVNSSDYYVYAIDRESGQLRWSRQIPIPIWSSMAADQGGIYLSAIDLPSTGAGVLRLNVKNGEPSWGYRVTGSVASSPVVIDGVLYFGTLDGALYALTGGKKRPRWKRQVESAFECSPTVANGVLYAGNVDGNVRALDARTGKEIWRFKTDGQVESSPSVGASVVVVTSKGHGVYALDADRGAMRWVVQTEIHKEYTSAAVGNDSCCICSTNGHVYSLDMNDGTQRWHYPARGVIEPSAPPVISDGVLYVGTREGYVHALTLDAGDWVWSRKIGDDIPSQVVVVDGVVYACSSASVYTLDAKTGRGPR